MDIPIDVQILQAVVAHPAAYQSSAIDSACASSIARSSSVPVKVLAAYLKTEGARPGDIRENTDGSYDVGPMQINSVNWPKFSQQYDLPPVSIRFDGCINLMVGAKLVQEKFSGFDRSEVYSWDVFYRIAANYHSATPHLNASYREKWIRNFNFILENGFEF